MLLAYLITRVCGNSWRRDVHTKYLQTCLGNQFVTQGESVYLPLVLARLGNAQGLARFSRFPSLLQLSA